MGRIDPQSWKEDLPAFAEKTAQFYAGELDKNAYKGFSGLYGSYAQKGGQASMLRLRMTAGRVTQEKLAFVARAIREYSVPRVHFTTGQTIQFHDLDQETVCAVMEQALDVGIVTMGGGGDFPRNVTCSPLAGLVPGERFDVLPWAEAAGEYLMHFVKAEKMPRKLKVAFAGSGENESHATYKDLGFVAREDGTFDVYSAGGLGNNPRFGVLVAEGVAPEKICYYIKAMWLTFRAYGNYENRGKARTRYMQEVCGGPEGYKKAYLEKLQEVLDSGEDLDLKLQPVPLGKKGNGTKASGPRVIRQKQEGLYAVAWHPIGGQADPETFCRVSDLLCAMEGAEMRLSPDETAYLVNLTGDQAEALLAATEEDTAHSRFETTVSCIGGATCQVGMRDSQALLRECVQAVRAAGLPDGALPQMHISGCNSSCGTHQTGVMGLRGGAKVVDGKAKPGFTLFLGGASRQGEEAMGRELGAIAQEDVPRFLVELGRAVAESGQDFAAWYGEDPRRVEEIAKAYL